MTDAVAVALLSSVGLVLVAAITTFGANIIPKLKRIESAAKEAKEQTANDHIYRDAEGNPILDRNGDTIPLNLRVDLDDKHEDVMQTLNMIARQSVSQNEILATHGQQIQSVFRILGIHTDQLGVLENTFTREQIKEILNNV